MFKVKVILDTNFLLIPAQFNVDIFSEIARIMDEPYQLCIMEKSFEELNKIITLSNSKDSRSAKLGLMLAKSLIKQKSLKTLTSFSNEYVDDLIVSKANKKVYVATQDKELKQRVKEKGAHIITLKQKKYLMKE